MTTPTQAGDAGPAEGEPPTGGGGASGDAVTGGVLFFGREPALWLAMIAALVQLSGLIWGVSDHNQALINAAAVAVAGAITAWIVREGQVAALLAVVKAGLALGAGFGLDLDAKDQAVVMALLTAASALVVRSQVVAPVARNKRKVTEDDVATGRV